MNLFAASLLVFECLDYDLMCLIQILADEELGADRPCMEAWMERFGAGEYRDLELALDLLGNLDAPL